MVANALYNPNIAFSEVGQALPLGAASTQLSVEGNASAVADASQPVQVLVPSSSVLW